MVGGIPYSIEIVLDNRLSIVYSIDTAIANRVIGRDCKQSLVPVGVLIMKTKTIRDTLDSIDLLHYRKMYADVLSRLHTCGPGEKAGLKQLLNYYYNLLN